MKVFLKCVEVSSETASFLGRGLVLTVFLKDYPDQDFNVGHEYELLLTK